MNDNMNNGMTSFIKNSVFKNEIITIMTKAINVKKRCFVKKK